VVFFFFLPLHVILCGTGFGLVKVAAFITLIDILGSLHFGLLCAPISTLSYIFWFLHILRMTLQADEYSDGYQTLRFEVFPQMQGTMYLICSIPNLIDIHWIHSLRGHAYPKFQKVSMFLPVSSST
jgi:uncharacterized membrane protein YjgN (DUF898 family)